MCISGRGFPPAHEADDLGSHTPTHVHVSVCDSRVTLCTGPSCTGGDPDPQIAFNSDEELTSLFLLKENSPVRAFILTI